MDFGLNSAGFGSCCPAGSAGPFFQWSRAVRIRTNLDLLLDWLQAVGLGDIAAEFFRKLSATANLLCTPRSSLSKVGFTGAWGGARRGSGGPH